MYAILETGGKQYRVAEGDVIVVEKLPGEAGDAISFDKVLLISDGADVKVGTPYIEGAKIAGEIIETGKGKKVIVYKYKSKKDYRKKQGHRQPYTSVEITSLTGEAKARKSAPKAEENAEAVVDTEVKQNAQETAKVNMNMKKEELIAAAEEQGIEIDPKATKAEIIEMIENASK